MPVHPGTTARSPRREPRKNTRGAAPERPLIEPDHRRHLIAEAAYYRAERRGFAPGYENEDWLAAEAEIDITLALGVSSADH